MAQQKHPVKEKEIKGKSIAESMEKKTPSEGWEKMKKT